jgi:hypothetical protein
MPVPVVVQTPANSNNANSNNNTNPLSEPVPLIPVNSFHENSSHSGSEVGGSGSGTATATVERVNPFEQQIIQVNSNASSSSLGTSGLHSAPSSPKPQFPMRAVVTTTTTATNAGPTMSPTPAAGLPRAPLDVPISSAHLPHFPTPEEDDTFTHSSSAVNSTEPASSYSTAEASYHQQQHPANGRSHQQQSQQQQQQLPAVAQTFVRFFESTRKRMSYTNSRNTSDEDLIEDLDGMIITGYLQKLGRNGKWQTRWFESDGECLSYYKNENRTKLLATLDLEKVCLCLHVLDLVGWSTVCVYIYHIFSIYMVYTCKPTRPRVSHLNSFPFLFLLIHKHFVGRSNRIRSSR